MTLLRTGWLRGHPIVSFHGEGPHLATCAQAAPRGALGGVVRRPWELTRRAPLRTYQRGCRRPGPPRGRRFYAGALLGPYGACRQRVRSSGACSLVSPLASHTNTNCLVAGSRCRGPTSLARGQSCRRARIFEGAGRRPSALSPGQHQPCWRPRPRWTRYVSAVRAPGRTPARSIRPPPRRSRATTGAAAAAKGRAHQLAQIERCLLRTRSACS